MLPHNLVYLRCIADKARTEHARVTRISEAMHVDSEVRKILVTACAQLADYITTLDPTPKEE